MDLLSKNTAPFPFSDFTGREVEDSRLLPSPPTGRRWAIFVGGRLNGVVRLVKSDCGEFYNIQTGETYKMLRPSKIKNFGAVFVNPGTILTREDINRRVHILGYEHKLGEWMGVLVLDPEFFNDD